jgi:hypothetical protein
MRNLRPEKKESDDDERREREFTDLIYGSALFIFIFHSSVRLDSTRLDSLFSNGTRPSDDKNYQFKEVKVL